ncbi:MAG: ferredoxin family protein [Candidatus Bathyarchaeia archaeon]
MKLTAHPSGAWYPTVFPDKCDGCATLGKPRCVEFCPNGVFSIVNDKVVVAFPHKCVDGCTACEPVCHKKAISFPRRTTAFAKLEDEDKGLLRRTVCENCGKTFWTNRDVDVCMDCEGKR